MFTLIVGQGKAKDWGMATYEQDWLVTQYEGSPRLQSIPGAGKTWLKAMADAATELNVTVQYCMALPRHMLQSASFERVTQARASHDYAQSRKDQWSTPEFNGLLYWAVGVLPFKDDFWTTSVQPGNPWGAAGVEQNPELQTLVSALLGGPVGPSDMLGLVNTTRLMQVCRKDGLLLKPDRPAYLADIAYTTAFASGEAPPHLWHTTSSAGDGSPKSHLVMAANMSHALQVPLSSLEAFDSKYLVKEYYSGETRLLSSSDALSVNAQKPPACPPGPGQCIPINLWQLAPVGPKYTLLGETGKFIAVSPQRFADLVSTTVKLQVTVSGAPGETVPVEVSVDASLTPQAVTCRFTSGEDLTLTCQGSSCSCQ